MSKNNFKSFAIVGASGSGIFGVGPLIAKELVEGGFNVRILGREASLTGGAAVELQKLGVSLHAIDYANPTSIFDALGGVDVLVSTLGGGFELQTVLGDQAKKAGVQLFIPSEYGVETNKSTKTQYGQHKKLIHDHLESIGLPYTLFHVGIFAEFVGWFFAVKDGKVTIPDLGHGNVKATATASSDIVEFIYKALTTLPLDKLANAQFRISGATRTVREFVAAMSVKQGPIEIVEVPVFTFQDKFIELNSEDTWNGLQVALAEGRVLIDGRDNDLFGKKEWIQPEAFM